MSKKRVTLFELCKAVADGKITLEKAATEYEIGGVLTKTDALNLYDTVIKQGDLLAKVRRVPCYSLKGNLNQYVSEGVFTNRADAGAAMSAVINGNDIANTNKDQIGNEFTLLERYYLFALLSEELVNNARQGRNRFQSETGKQINTGMANTLENQLIAGDGTGSNVIGIRKRCIDNLATSQAEEDSGKKIRNIDTNLYATQTARLKAVYNKQLSKYRSKSTFIMNEDDYNTYEEEVNATTSFNGSKNTVEKKNYPFKSRQIIASPYVAANEIYFGPLDNICNCIDVVGMKRTTKMQDIPETLVYGFKMHVDFQFATNDKVTFGYKAT